MKNPNNPQKQTNYPLSKRTSEDFAVGAAKTLVNAQEKFEVAKMIYEKHPATSVSILITSLEELAKALYLKVLSRDPKKVYIVQLEKIFYKHERKHEAIGTMFGAYIIRKNKEVPSTALATMLGLLGVIIVGALSQMKRTPGNGIRNLEFVRKRGLYLDLDKETGEWISPQDYISSEDLLEWLKLSETFFDDVQTSYFSDSEKPLEELIESLYDETVQLKK